VRYLGDMSGGQFIRRRIAKAYNIDLDRGDGIRFYDFKKLGDSEAANTGDLKKVKEWYREGMNAGIGDDIALKGLMIFFELSCVLLNPWFASGHTGRGQRRLQAQLWYL
jgi:heme oxygenase